jgi:hypothetical protein
MYEGLEGRESECTEELGVEHLKDAFPPPNVTLPSA